MSTVYLRGLSQTTALISPSKISSINASPKLTLTAPPVGSGITLQALSLSGFSLAENSAPGTIVGTILNTTPGSTLSLANDAGGRFAIASGKLVAGLVATDYESATSHNITIQETLTGAIGSPKSTILTITITNQFEQPNLGALTLSATNFVPGTPSSGTIVGATSGSTIAATGLPAGLTINGPARTWDWDGSGAVSTGTLTLTETLNDSANSPRSTDIGYSISAVLQALALSANSLAENSPAGTVVGTILNTTAGSTLTLTDDAGGRFAISSGSLVAGATASDYETATSYNVTIQETLAGATGSPKSTTLTINITDVVDTLSTPTFLVWDGVGDQADIASYGSSETGVPDPPQFWFAFGSDVGEGDFVEFQIDAANTYSTGNLRTESRVLQWTGTAFQFADPTTDVPGDFTIQTGLTPSTTYYMRRRVRRDLGDTSIYSNWTPDVTVSVASSGITFALNAANHATWDAADQQLLNSNTTWKVLNGATGAHSSIRGMLPISGNGTKVYFEIVVDSIGAADSNGGFGLCTDTYGGSGTPGSLASVGDSEANLNQTVLLWGNVGSGNKAALFVANAFVEEVTPQTATHHYGLAVEIRASDALLKLYEGGVQVGQAGGYVLPFTAVKPLISCNPTSGGMTQQFSLATLAQATANCPPGFTPAGC